MARNMISDMTPRPKQSGYQIVSPRQVKTGSEIGESFRQQYADQELVLAGAELEQYLKSTPSSVHGYKSLWDFYLKRYGKIPLKLTVTPMGQKAGMYDAMHSPLTPDNT